VGISEFIYMSTSDEQVKWISRLSPLTVFGVTSNSMIFKNVTWNLFTGN